MTETDIKRQILEMCLRHPRVGSASRFQAGMIRKGRSWIHMGTVGWPDIVGFLKDGRFLGIEVKDPAQPKSAHAKRRKLQEEFRVRANNAGCYVFQAESVDEATERLNRIKEE